MKISIIPNMEKVNTSENLTRIFEKLSSLNADICMNADNYKYFKDLSIQWYDNDSDMFLNSDICIVLGGDGTIIHAAKNAAIYNKPVLGINVGRLGFLAGLEIDEIDKLDALFNNKYKIERRMMLEISTDDKTEYALNDVVISKSIPGRIADFKLLLNEKPIVSYRADGIIVSTPTGSTAYSLSSGGPVIDPQMQCILATPICSHSLVSRSILFRDDSKLSVYVPSYSVEKGSITIDGQYIEQLEYNQNVNIKKADKYALIIRIKDANFYQTLNEKLMDRRK